MNFAKVSSILRQGKVPRVLKFEVRKKPLEYREGVDMLKRGCSLRESVRRIRRRLGLDEEKKEKKWIQDVVKKAEQKGTKGKFREWCIKQGFSGVNKSCIQKAKKVAKEKGDTTLLRRAIAAENMMKASGAIK